MSLTRIPFDQHIGKPGQVRPDCWCKECVTAVQARVKESKK